MDPDAVASTRIITAMQTVELVENLGLSKAKEQPGTLLVFQTFQAAVAHSLMGESVIAVMQNTVMRTMGGVGPLPHIKMPRRALHTIVLLIVHHPVVYRGAGMEMD